MTSDQLLRMLRRRLRDVDSSAVTYGNDVLWGYVADCLLRFNARKTQGFTSYVVTDEGDEDTFGITPEPTDAHGVMLAVGAAAMLLADLYAERVRSGTLGVTWASGLESESTITQQRAYAAAIAELDAELEQLILIQAGARTGSRIQ